MVFFTEIMFLKKATEGNLKVKRLGNLCCKFIARSQALLLRLAK